MLGEKTSTYTVSPLHSIFPLHTEDDNYWIYGGLLPDKNLVDTLKQLPKETSLIIDNQIIASRCSDFPFNNKTVRQAYHGEAQVIRYPWEIFQKNGEALQRDFALIAGENSPVFPEDADVRLIRPENIFIEKDTTILCSTINASAGPVYIGKGAVIMEGCHIRGPFALGEGAVLKMGTKVYGATTIGPYSMFGGEINNSVVFGYSNKAHEGYMGNSVIGEWCNWGADTTCSNLKNTVEDIHIAVAGKPVKVGKKCGVMMGDFSRTAVHTTINSGTVVGVSAHLFGAGFFPKEVPSFCWGRDEKYFLDKALKDADNWMRLKGRSLDDGLKDILKSIYENNR